eukprot:comp20893_c0_seq1/m.27777 comp20893_c0_seq1/g.27777  ORF comp20893_c0_seq1/g.27777 comp20893_c0_seq1/m.27777 type:complete len:390 (+) comp20893_c0_seq1:2628-3797(+)
MLCIKRAGRGSSFRPREVWRDFRVLVFAEPSCLPRAIAACSAPATDMTSRGASGFSSSPSLSWSFCPSCMDAESARAICRSWSLMSNFFCRVKNDGLGRRATRVLPENSASGVMAVIMPKLGVSVPPLLASLSERPLPLFLPGFAFFTPPSSFLPAAPKPNPTPPASPPKVNVFSFKAPSSEAFDCWLIEIRHFLTISTSSDRAIPLCCAQSRVWTVHALRARSENASWHSGHRSPGADAASFGFTLLFAFALCASCLLCNSCISSKHLVTCCHFLCAVYPPMLLPHNIHRPMSRRSSVPFPEPGNGLGVSDNVSSQVGGGCGGCTCAEGWVVSPNGAGVTLDPPPFAIRSKHSFTCSSLCSTLIRPSCFSHTGQVAPSSGPSSSPFSS